MDEDASFDDKVHFVAAIAELEDDLVPGEGCGAKVARDEAQAQVVEALPKGNSWLTSAEDEGSQ